MGLSSVPVAGTEVSDMCYLAQLIQDHLDDPEFEPLPEPEPELPEIMVPNLRKKSP